MGAAMPEVVLEAYITARTISVFSTYSRDMSSIKLKRLLSMVLAANFQLTYGLGAFFCNDINFQTNCAHWTNLVPNKCYTLDAQHQDQVSSFGPDQGTVCDLSADYHCSSSPATLGYPGSPDLRNVVYAPAPGVAVPVNDNMNSFSCFVSG
ncbi:unnamed protein product [Mycena citricolor]|uniref:Uncharacterized protein n=1 Tax=Mycena citricolor TaxID=2018698 RepID=A0AAD2K5A9_9AGAR|nr:unnamed protein product [Mycena citricolor]